ncbi:hypothetical protein [Thauera mechernichensis]
MQPAPTIAVAAERLTAETGEAWTADRVLRVLAEQHSYRLDFRPTLLVSLPPNWPLIDAETGEAAAVPVRATARVGHAYFYLWQILDGAQDGDAVGTPVELEIEGRRFTTNRPLPASAIRLQEHDIALLAQAKTPPRQKPQPAKPNAARTSSTDQDGSWNTADGRARRDDLQIEIDDVAAQIEAVGEKPTARKIMEILRSKAGRPDSCVDAVTPDGIVWTRRSTGKVEELTLRSLHRRLTRPAKVTLSPLR